ncbi:hypothetical protein NPIL_683531 [Nephila pilipes]|uniref:Uncharacterized protein n=1 Tax=Nephila pilipes TaxID=299642 RepID=A0A8X6NBQ1_NEPPI|nr:hypothetical protein NPIL_683531 [Nephila pilipes]
MAIVTEVNGAKKEEIGKTELLVLQAAKEGAAKVRTTMWYAVLSTEGTPNGTVELEVVSRSWERTNSDPRKSEVIFPGNLSAKRLAKQ